MKKPMDPSLPGPYGQMTRQELDAEVARIESEVEPEGTPISKAEWAKWKRDARAERRRRGRPAKRESEKVARIQITMPRELLAAVDAAAEARDVSRAALVAQSLRKLLKLSA